MGQIATTVYEGSSAPFFAVASLMIAILGILLGYYLYGYRPQVSSHLAKIFKRSHYFASHKFFVDELYGKGVVTPILGISRFFWKIADYFFIDGIVNGIAKLIRTSGNIVAVIQTGRVQTYALFMIFGLIFMFFFLIQMLGAL